MRRPGFLAVAGDAAERAVIAGFGLSRFEPYRAGEMFPMDL